MVNRCGRVVARFPCHIADSEAGKINMSSTTHPVPFALCAIFTFTTIIHTPLTRLTGMPWLKVLHPCLVDWISGINLRLEQRLFQRATPSSCQILCCSDRTSYLLSAIRRLVFLPAIYIPNPRIEDLQPESASYCKTAARVQFWAFIDSSPNT